MAFLIFYSMEIIHALQAAILCHFPKIVLMSTGNQDAGDDHLLIFLYVYRDPRHLDEIMTVLRLAS